MKNIVRTCLFLSAFAAAGALRAADSPVRELTLIKIKYQGKIVWLPSPIVMKKGETLRLTLVNSVQDDPNVHGFSVPQFGVKADVVRDKPMTIEFKADKAGLFVTNCHLHPAHLSGQLLVLEK
jgi:cytochrome c oxidase subunit II